MTDEDSGADASRRRNNAIEKGMLLAEQARDTGGAGGRGSSGLHRRTGTKILLLGTGESGKSTVLKQMRLLHHNGFSQQERQQYAQVVWVDAIQLMKILVMQARKMGILLACDQPGSVLAESRRTVLLAQALELIDADAAGGPLFLNDYVVKYLERSQVLRVARSTGQATAAWDGLAGDGHEYTDAMSFDELTAGLAEGGHAAGSSQTRHERRQAIADAIDLLWRHDPGIAQCYARANEFQLEGSAAYYFEHIRSLADPGYVCLDEDILRGRIKTTGLTETHFTNGGRLFTVVDTGGQRLERRKWIHLFQDISAVLFVLAVLEYDQVLFEDERVNRMHELMALFLLLCNSRWFRNTPFILFLNKMDLLASKVAVLPVRNHFPDYPGRSGSSADAAAYFEQVFSGLNRTNRPMYVHRTCATDTQSMQFVLQAATDMVMQQNLKASGLL